MVRNISLPDIRTLWYPGATVKDMTTLLPEAISPNSKTHTVTVHVGFTDTKYVSSELLRSDFMELIAKRKYLNKCPIISGPIPATRRGYGRFSRLLLLQVLLKSYCNSNFSLQCGVSLYLCCMFEMTPECDIFKGLFWVCYEYHHTDVEFEPVCYGRIIIMQQQEMLIIMWIIHWTKI